MGARYYHTRQVATAVMRNGIREQKMPRPRRRSLAAAHVYQSMYPAATRRYPRQSGAVACIAVYLCIGACMQALTQAGTDTVQDLIRRHKDGSLNNTAFKQAIEVRGETVDPALVKYMHMSGTVSKNRAGDAAGRAHAGSCTLAADAAAAAAEFTQGRAKTGRCNVLDLSANASSGAGASTQRSGHGARDSGAHVKWPSSACGCLRFFVLGSEHSGAASLAHWLTQHPDLDTPLFAKILNNDDDSNHVVRMVFNIFIYILFNILSVLVCIPCPLHIQKVYRACYHAHALHAFLQATWNMFDPQQGKPSVFGRLQTTGYMQKWLLYNNVCTKKPRLRHPEEHTKYGEVLDTFANAYAHDATAQRTIAGLKEHCGGDIRLVVVANDPIEHIRTVRSYHAPSYHALSYHGGPIRRQLPCTKASTRLRPTILRRLRLLFFSFMVQAELWLYIR